MAPPEVDSTRKKDPTVKRGAVRINALLWADILVAYALFVMQDYLTGVWNLSFTHAAGIINFWGGITKILPLFFLFFVDSLLGNFKMLLISSVSYSVGIGLLTLSTPSVTGTCSKDDPECIGHTQKVLFYTGMALIAVGVAGNQVSVDSFRDEQEDDPEPGFKFFGFVIIVFVPIIGAIALPYVKPWTLRFGIPAICTLVATILFLTGTCGGWAFEKPGPPPEGSPIGNIWRVFVAAASNMFVPYPNDNADYHREKDDEAFRSTRCLRFLEKAAINTNKGNQSQSSLEKDEIKPDEEDPQRIKQKLCTVAEVEEAKIALRMVPMWMTFVVCGIISSVANTYFVEQASNMNRKVGKLKLPPQILLLVSDWTKKFLRSKFANSILGKKGVKSEDANKKIAPAIGIGIGMTFSIICCVVAAAVEIRRLKVVRRNGLLDKPDDEIPMNILWLIFQFVLLAGLDLFLEDSVNKFYDYQSPESMTNYLEYFTQGVTGLGFMCSVLSVYVVGKVSEKGGKPNWFQYTLNRSRLDRYYWVLAGLSSVNMVVFAVVASFYRYKPLPPAEEERGGEDGEDAAGLITESLFCCCSK